jgi:hypothetical protein
MATKSGCRVRGRCNFRHIEVVEWLTTMSRDEIEQIREWIDDYLETGLG